MRDVLVISVGATPQVVTETLWALVNRPDERRVVPDCIYALTTAGPRESIIEKTLGGECGKIAEFCAEFGLAPIPIEVVLARPSAGAPPADLRDTEGNIAFADTAARLIRDLALDPDTRIHVSIAGGRKTMSFYLGYAISLFGRPQDVLSHVLVSPEFEGCPDFWWINIQPRDVENKFDKKTYSTADAKIELAEIPFLRLCDFLTEPIFREDRVDFGHVVETMQASLQRTRLHLADDQRLVLAGDARFQLPHQQYAFYRTMAEAARRRWPGAGPDGVGKGHFGWLTQSDFNGVSTRGTTHYLKFYEAAFLGPSGQPENAVQYIEAIGDGSLDGRIKMELYFRPIRSKLFKLLKEHIAYPSLRERFGVPSRRGRFGLLLEPDEIVVESS